MDKNALNVMKKAFLYDEQYIALVKRFKEESRGLKMLENLKMPQEQYAKHQKEKQDELKKAVREYVSNRKAQLAHKKQNIETIYKAKMMNDEVADPAQELIRRQNVQARLALMTDNDFKEHLMQQTAPAQYDLHIMQQEANRRGLGAEFQAVLRNAQQPYLKDPDYQELQAAESFMLLIDKPHDLVLYDYDSSTDSVKTLSDFDLGRV